MVVVRLLPGKTLVSTAKSPSSREGINSPPILLKIKLPIQINYHCGKTIFGILRTFRKL
jgi:hypothetical protein